MKYMYNFLGMTFSSCLISLMGSMNDFVRGDKGDLMSF
jgi:hypothetical protein